MSAGAEASDPGAPTAPQVSGDSPTLGVLGVARFVASRQQALAPALLLSLGVLLGGYTMWAQTTRGWSGWGLVLTPGTLFLIAGVLRVGAPGSRRLGLLMLWVAAATYAEDVQFSPDPVIHTLGVGLRCASDGPLAHLMLAYPTGRLLGRAERAVTAAAYAYSIAALLDVPFIRTPTPGDTPNLLYITFPGPLFEAILWLSMPIGLAVVVVLCRNWWRASPRARVVLAPVVLTGLATAAAVLWVGVAEGAGRRTTRPSRRSGSATC